MLLAKNLKIKTLKKQRDYIQKSIFSLASRGVAGDPSFSYSGYIYPEVIRYFVEQGFDIRLERADIVIATNKGKPIYIFTPRDDLELSEKEMRRAENYVVTQVLNERQTDAEVVADELLNSIFGRDKN